MDAAAPFLPLYQTVLNSLFSLYLRTSPHLFSTVSSVNYFSKSSLAYENPQSLNESCAEDQGTRCESSLSKRNAKLSWQTAVLIRLSLGWLFDISNFSQSLFFKMASSYDKCLQPEG